MNDSSVDTTKKIEDWTFLVWIDKKMREALASNPQTGHVALTPTSGGETNWLPCEVVGITTIGDSVGLSVVVAGTNYAVRFADVMWDEQ